MAPCDPYSEPDRWPTAHERLITYLNCKEAISTAQSLGGGSGQRDLPTELVEMIISYVSSETGDSKDESDN